MEDYRAEKTVHKRDKKNRLDEQKQTDIKVWAKIVMYIVL